MYNQSMRTLGGSIGGFRIILVSLFLILGGLNLRGMVPYLFSSTRHLAFSLSLGLPI